MELSRSKQRAWKWWKTLLAVAVALCVLFTAGQITARYVMESVMLTTGPNGPETPATVGVPFERVAIPSGSRRLDSYLVTAGATCADAPVVVIYPGVNETISEWVKAQRYLYDHCISSVIFNYTGSGNSSRPARFEAIGDDSIAAYEFAVGSFPGKRIFLLGHSMGNAPMLEVVPQLSSQPAGVVVANAFASLRSAAHTRKNLFYRLLAYTIPDWWDNVQAVQHVHVPLLVIHSDTDQVNPVEAGRKIFAAALQPKTLVILHGYRHNDLYQNPSDDWWSAVVLFLKNPNTAAIRTEHNQQ